MNNYEFNLSDDQQKIVDAIEDNILVIACPGSGKTHTLIARYINLLSKCNIKPIETIMITFTKKAGIEMLNRLNKIIPDKIPYHVGTIHGLSYKILKEYNNLKNIIIDELDIKSYLIDIINNE
jgi:DNA helicase-2/ATP-dependent DNA helicase PcrA